MTDTPFTVGDLKRQLAGISDDAKLSFDGALTFGRLKRWGDNGYVLLFAEPQADLDQRFKARNPHIKVAFVSIDDISWDESGVIGGPVDVSIR